MSEEPVDIFDNMSEASSTYDEVATKRRRSKRKRKRSKRRRGRSAWQRTLGKHRTSRSPFTYKGKHYHWGRKRGKNGQTLVYPKRGRGRAMHEMEEMVEQPTAAKMSNIDEFSDSDSYISGSSSDSALSFDSFESDVSSEAAPTKAAMRTDAFDAWQEADTSLDVFEQARQMAITKKKASTKSYGPYEFSNLYHRHDSTEPVSVTVPKETITVRKMNTVRGPRYQAAADVQGGPHNREYHLRKFISRATAKKFHNYPHGNGHPAEHFTG